MRRHSWQAIGSLLIAASAAVGFIYLMRDDPAAVVRMALKVGVVLLALAVGLLAAGAVMKQRSRRHEMVASYSASIIVKEASLAFLLWFIGHNLVWAASLTVLASLLLWLLGTQLLVLAISVGAVAAAAFVLVALVSPVPVRMLGVCWRIFEPMSGLGPLAYAEAAVAIGPRLQAVTSSDLASAAAVGGRPLWKRMQDAFDLDRVEHDCPRISFGQPLGQALLHELQVRSRTLGLIALIGFLIALVPLSFTGSVMPGVGGGTPFVSARQGDTERERESEEQSEEPEDDRAGGTDDAEPDRSRTYDESQVENGDEAGDRGGRGSEARSSAEIGDDSGLLGDSIGDDPNGEMSSGEPGEGTASGSEGTGGEPGGSVSGDGQQGGQAGSDSDSHPGPQSGTGGGVTSDATLKPHKPEDCPDPFRCQKPGCVAARSGEGSGSEARQRGQGGSGGSQQGGSQQGGSSSSAQQGGTSGSGGQPSSSGGASQQGGAGDSGSQPGGSGGASQQGGTGGSGSHPSGSGGASQEGGAGGSGSEPGGSGGASQQGGASGSGSQPSGSGGASQQGGAGGSGSQPGGSSGDAQQSGAGSGGSGAGAAGGGGGQGGAGGSAAGGAGTGGSAGEGGQGGSSAGEDLFGAGGSGGGSGGGEGSGAGQAAGTAGGTSGEGGVGQSGEGGGGSGGGGSGWGSSSAFSQNGDGTGPLTFPAPSELISIDLPTISGRHVPLIPGVPEDRGDQAARSGAENGSLLQPPPATDETHEPQTPGQPRQQLPAWIASLLQPSGTGN